MSPIIEKKTMKEKINYYDWLYQKCNEVNKGNKQCIKDKFWLNLTKILIENKILSFNTSTVKFINNKIAEQVVD